VVQAFALPSLTALLLITALSADTAAAVLAARLSLAVRFTLKLVGHCLFIASAFVAWKGGLTFAFNIAPAF